MSSASLFTVARLAPARRLGVRFLGLVLCIGMYSTLGMVGESIQQPDALSQGPAIAWWSAILASVGVLSLSALGRPGRSFLATVALCWWIPAILPPSFLIAVPRALRNTQVGSLTGWLPQNPGAWLADTTWVAGLLLLAWSARRPTSRADEIRDPG